MRKKEARRRGSAQAGEVAHESTEADDDGANLPVALSAEPRGCRHGRGPTPPNRPRQEHEKTSNISSMLL